MPEHLRQNRVYWVLALLSLGGYAIMRVWFPLSPFALANPLPDQAHFATWPWLTLAYACLLCVQFALYWLAFREVNAGRAPTTLWAVLIPAALFAALLVGAFTINATDLHRYVMHARVQAIFGQNPYTTPLNAIRNDPYLYFAGEWSKETSPYGPIWQMASQALVWISGNDFAQSLWLFKGLTAGLSLGIAGLIWLALRQLPPSERLGRVLLWAWNPALWLIFAVDGHNDSMVLFWLVLGWLLISRGRPTLGLIVMALAPLVKMSGLLPIPFFAVSVWHSLPSQRARAKVLLPALAGMAAVTLLAFLPFGSPLDLVARLVREASQAGGFSPLVTLVLIAYKLGQNPPVDTLIGGAGLVLALIALGLAWCTWRGRSAVRAAADINAAYLLLAFSFRIWYASWVFPWLVLDPSEGRSSFRLRAGIWFLLTTQLSVLLYGQLRRAMLGGDITWAHVLGIPFVFGLPLLFAYLGGRRK